MGRHEVRGIPICCGAYSGHAQYLQQTQASLTQSVCRFVASKEAGAPKRHKAGVVEASVHDTTRTLVFTGRPMRIKKNDYVMDWYGAALKHTSRYLSLATFLMCRLFSSFFVQFCPWSVVRC